MIIYYKLCKLSDLELVFFLFDKLQATVSEELLTSFEMQALDDNKRL